MEGAMAAAVPQPPPPPMVFLPRREVERRVGLKRSTIYARVDAKTFPAPVRDLDTGTVWWLEHEIAEWQKKRVDARSMGRSMGTE